jgi:hypothetical protein
MRLAGGCWSKITGPDNLKAQEIVEASLMACFFCMWQDKKTGSVSEPVFRNKKVVPDVE